jgi:hypothetical protein
MNNSKQTAQYKATEYIYDLGNAALENGFKNDERWEVHMSTAAEKKALEKQYHPTVASVIVPELLNATFCLVKSELKQAIKETVMAPEDRFSVRPEYEYLVAFNPNRLRR